MHLNTASLISGMIELHRIIIPFNDTIFSISNQKNPPKLYQNPQKKKPRNQNQTKPLIFNKSTKEKRDELPEGLRFRIVVELLRLKILTCTCFSNNG